MKSILILGLFSPIAFAVGEIDHWKLTHVDYDLDFVIVFHNCTYMRVGELADTETDKFLGCDFYARTMGEPELYMDGNIIKKEGIEFVITEYERMVRDVREQPHMEASLLFPEVIQ